MFCFLFHFRNTVKKCTCVSREILLTYNGLAILNIIATALLLHVKYENCFLLKEKYKKNTNIEYHQPYPLVVCAMHHMGLSWNVSLLRLRWINTKENSTVFWVWTLADSPGCDAPVKQSCAQWLLTLFHFYVATGLIFIVMVFREYSSPLKVLHCTPAARGEGPQV